MPNFRLIGYQEAFLQMAFNFKKKSLLKYKGKNEKSMFYNLHNILCRNKRGLSSASKAQAFWVQWIYFFLVWIVDCWIVGLLNCWIAELLICWIVEWLNCWSVELLSCWIVELLKCWGVGLLDCWIVELLKFWSVEMLNC